MLIFVFLSFVIVGANTMKLLVLTFLLLSFFTNIAQAQYFPDFPVDDNPTTFIEGTIRKIKDYYAYKRASIKDEGKFLITDMDTDSPKLYFQIPSKFPMHYQLAEKILGSTLSPSQFATLCQSKTKKYICGYLKYTPRVDPEEREVFQETYIWSVVEKDQIGSEDVIKANRLL
jgi:hypothetical protein